MLAADEIKRLLAVANEPLEDEEDNQAVAAPEPRLDFATRPESFASLDNRPAEQEAEDEEGAIAIEDALASVGAFQTPEYRTPRTLTEEFSTGLARGTDQTQGLGYGLVGLMGQTLGVEGMENYGLENYVRKMEEAAQNQATVQDPFEEIGGLGDAATYAAGLLGEQIPQLLVSAVGGGVGGFAAKTVAKKIVANEIGKRVAAGLAKEVAEKEVAGMVAKRMLLGEGAELINKAATRGAIGGAYAANFGQIAGGSFGQIAQETGEGDALAAAAFAVPGAALDTLGEVFIAGKFLKPFTKTGRAAAEGVDAATGISFPGRVARSVGVGLPAAATLEGGTEYVQTGLEQAALGAADPNRTIEEVVGTPEAERERQIAAVAGATVGGGLGGAGSVIEALAPQTAEKLRRTTQPKPVNLPGDPESGQPLSVIEGNWSEPKTLGGFEFRRNEAGQVAIFNPDPERFGKLPRFSTPQGEVFSPIDGVEYLNLPTKSDKVLAQRARGLFDDDEVGSTPVKRTPVQKPKPRTPSREAVLDDGPDMTPAGQAVGSNVRFNGYEGSLAQDGARFLLRGNDGTEVEVPAESEVEIVAAPAPTRLTTTSIPAVQTPPVEQPAPMPDLATMGAEEISKAALARPEVSVVDQAAETAETLDRNAVTLLQDARTTLESSIGEIERRELAPEAKSTLTEPLYQKLVQVEDTLSKAPAEATALDAEIQKSKQTIADTKVEQVKVAQQTVNRPPDQSRQFVESLQPKDKVTVYLSDEKADDSLSFGATFEARRPNGNVVVVTEPDAEGNQEKLVFTPQQYNRLGMFKQPAPKQSPVDVAVNSVLGPKPTKAKAERVFGTPYQEGKPQEAFFDDGLYANPGKTNKVPGEVRYFDKEGEPGVKEVVNFGKWQGNSRGTLFTTVRQMNLGLDVPVPDDQLQNLPEGVQVEPRTMKNGQTANVVTKVVYNGNTYRRGDAAYDFSVNGENTGPGGFDNIYFNSPERLLRSERARKGKQTQKEKAGKTVGSVQAKLESLDEADQFFVGDARARAARFIDRRSDLDPEAKAMASDEADASIIEQVAGRDKKGVPPVRDLALFKRFNSRMLDIFESNQENETGADTGRDVQEAARQITEELVASGQTAAQASAAVEPIVKRWQSYGDFSPIKTAMTKAQSAKKSAVRTGRNQRAAEADLAAGTTGDARPQQTPAERFAERTSDEAMAGRERLGRVVGEDRDLLDAYWAEEELSETDRQRVEDLLEYIQGNKTYEQINQTTEQGSAILSREPRDGDNLRRDAVAEGRAGGLAESRGRGRNQAGAGRGRNRVGRTDGGQAGTVPGAAPVAGGRSGLGGTPDQRNASTARRAFVGSFIGDRSLVAGLSEAVVEKIYQAVSTTLDALAATKGRRVVAATEANMADLMGRSVEELVAGYQEEFSSYMANRERIDAIRRNAQEAVRSRIFEGPKAALEFMAQDGDRPAFMRMIAKVVLSQGQRFGLNIDDIAMQVGIFRRNFATQPLRGEEVRARVQEVQGEEGEGVFEVTTPDGVETYAFGGESGRTRKQAGKEARARAFDLVTGQTRTSWAGVLGVDENATSPVGRYSVVLNLDNWHEADDIGLTMLHEIAHVFSKTKFAGLEKLNTVEKAAIKGIEAFRVRMLKAVARTNGLEVPAGNNPTTLAQLSRQVDDLSNPNVVGADADRRFAYLVNAEETARGLMESPEFLKLALQLGLGKAKTKGKKTSLSGPVAEAWGDIVDLNSGKKTAETSPLATAFQDAWAATFGALEGTTEGYAKPPIGANPLAQDLAALDQATNFIEDQIITRGLTGTTAEREALLQEFMAARNMVQGAEAVVEEADADVDTLADPLTMSRAVTPQMDREYLAAVERGDMETAQRMVDEAAKAAGYNIGPVWHGTDAYFSTFDKDKLGSVSESSDAALGFWFSESEERAWMARSDAMRASGNTVAPPPLRVSLKLDAPFTVDESIKNYTSEDTAKIIEDAADKGHDGVIFLQGEAIGKDVIAFEPNKIKRTDAITRDNRRNVIPLSQRFNEQSPDIRESRAISNESREALSNQGATNDRRNQPALQATTPGVGSASGGVQVQRQAVRPNAEPNPFVQEGVSAYNARYGLGEVVRGHYAPVDEQRARSIAAAYDALPVLDEGRETQDAYRQLGFEIQQQWDYAINTMGVTFEPWTTEGQPYANSREMVRDVRDNKHLWFFTGGEPHPLLNQPDADGLTMNDKLRAIHDLFGHAAEDYQFGARGEENAWIKHSQMFTPLAQRALTTETRGQNSWVNYGAHNYATDGTRIKVPASERPFATQKVALLPEDVMDWRGALAADTVTESRAVAVSPADVASVIRNAGGITVDIWTGDQPGTGYIVAPFKETETRILLNDFAPSDVRSFIQRFKGLLEVNGMHLGGWISGQQVYLDTSIVTNDELTATLIAQDGNQLAIFDRANFIEIPTRDLVERYGRGIGESRSRVEYQDLARSLREAKDRVLGGVRGSGRANVSGQGTLQEGAGLTNESLTESRATSASPNLIYQDSEGELRGRPRETTNQGYLRSTLLRLEESANQGRDLGAGESFRFRADTSGETDQGLEQRRRAQAAAAFEELAAILEEQGLILDPESFENTVIEGRDKIGDGSEHQVHSDKPTNRVIKYTNPDVTGSGVVGQSLNVFDYLRNLAAQNEIFGDDIRLEGIVNLGEPFPRVVISQSFVKGRDSTPKEIDAYLKGRGFEKQEDGSWIRVRDGQIQRVWDAVPGNLKTVKVGKKSTVVPFDVQISVESVAAESRVEESRARGRVWRPVTRRTPTGGTISRGGMFAVDELLDKRAGDLYRSSRMAIKVDVSKIQDLSRVLERQIKNFYKGETPPLETINTALGNLDNPLTEQQIGEIEDLRARGLTNQAAKKRDQYIRDNRRNFKQNKQTQALAQLPEELAETIREMSSHIESLSRELPREGLVNGDLAITVDEALGTYLNRSYAIFDDPLWGDRVRKDAKVMDAARKYIRNSLTKAKAQDLIADAADEGRTLSRIDAEALANDSVLDDEVENLLEGYLAIGAEAPTIEVLSGRIPGQKNLSMFNQRGNIAPEIQALWGRYEDPTVNYAKTVMKLSSVIANDNFLKELRDLGIQEGWLWSRENNPDDTRHPPGYVRISTEKNPSLRPLGGMYVHPDLAEGLFKMFPVGSTEEHYAWLRALMKLTGISMATKTVGSVASQVRNFFGNYMPLIAGGNLGLDDITSGDFKRRFANSNDTVLASTFGKYRNMSRAEWRVKIDDYIRRGIVGESITTGLLEDLLTASRRAGSPDFGDFVWNKVGDPFKRVADFAVRTYSAGDDWFKVMIYEAEQDKYRKAFPDWDDNKIKEKAAVIARDIHWTYSLAPAIVQDLKKFPFIAPFVTFTSEVIRTTYNLLKLARQEITEGRATGNKELEAIGWKRVRGMTIAAFLPFTVGSAAMAMAGISGEDEEDLRRFLPDWQKNSQLVLFRKANGEVDFLDVSFLDPYEYFKKPLTAFMRSMRSPGNADEILLKGTMDMVRQAIDPFTSEQIFAGAIMDVMRNRDAAGRQVYNPQDTGANIGLSVARKIFYDPFIPGTVNSAERIGKAAFGIESETGRSYNLINELSSVALGQRVSSVDAQQALQFKSSRFMREMRDASALFNREFTAQGTRSAGDVIDGYARSNAARRSLIDSIRRDYLAAIRLGVSVQRAKAILRDGGLGGDTIKMVTTGIYKPYDASKQSLDLVRARGKNDRISAYNQARRSAAPREILAD
jgi:hypothetical protein